jgi:hypothetical protein
MDIKPSFAVFAFAKALRADRVWRMSWASSLARFWSLYSSPRPTRAVSTFLMAASPVAGLPERMVLYISSAPDGFVADSFSASASRRASSAVDTAICAGVDEGLGRGRSGC